MSHPFPKRSPSRLKRRCLIGLLVAGLLIVLWSGGKRLSRLFRTSPDGAKYVIILIGDGLGAKHMEAAEAYRRKAAPYASWPRTWAATYADRGSYDPGQAWSDFEYVNDGATDSAAAATAMFTGKKTASGRVAVSADSSERLVTIAELAHDRGLAAGAVTSVEISDATPGAWAAHNNRRRNGFAIADEELWGNPLATGTVRDSPYYGGSHGPTWPPLEVLIGAGHPDWSGGHFVNKAIRDKLARESGLDGAFFYLERRPGQDAGPLLYDLASQSSVTRLAGLFGGTDGHLEYGLADGSGANPENPTLADMTHAALEVLGRSPHGFALVVEGGAIDMAAHDGQMNRLLGEVLDFFASVQTVMDWVEDPANDSTWDNTLVIVTADHETGYLTAGPEVFPDRPLGEVDARTLSLEKSIAEEGLRASWEDADGDSRIDPGERVYWCWNTTGHTNSLVPLYARGVGAALLGQFTEGRDPVRGSYVQNTAVFRIVDRVAGTQASLKPNPSPSGRR